MKLFNILGRKRKKSIKELYAPVIDQMWCCVVNFCPWRPNDHRVVFKKVNIVKAEADKDGIWVTSDFNNPYNKYSNETDFISGYIDKITIRFHTSGFFDTEEEAKVAYNKLMEDWIAVIKNGMVATR